MTNTILEDVEASLTTLQEKLPDLSVIKNALWKTTPQCQTLLKEITLAKGVKITGTPRRFSPEKLTFLTLIMFYGENPEKISTNLTLKIKYPDKAPVEFKLTTGKTYCFAWIYKFCEWFEISTSSTFSKPYLTRIDIYGADMPTLNTYSGDIQATIDLKNKIEEYKTKTIETISKSSTQNTELTATRDALNADISLLEETKSTQLEKIESLKATIELSQEKLKQIQLESAHNEKTLTNAKNNIDQLRQQTDNINRNISDLNSELEKLTQNRNLISDEYGPYVKEGRSQAAIYVAIVSLPLLVILFSVYELYAGASKLLTGDYNTFTEVVGAFILRIPFAAVFGLAIYYSWRVTSAIIQKIFTIHSDRLSLAKLLILAREAVHTAAKDIEISNEAIFQEQIKLKVEVLKSHLSRDLGKDFQYNPKQEAKHPTPPPKNSEAVNDSETPDEEESAK
ncbi:hypothetical protein [Pseudomonas gessardii]|uniref:hypothetical protein n=1 Tax=Pseudomonas gessardii TaxID=78544 RepID=UPI0014737A45|nr:hypothetical protein [Pseudomonas gessardii]NNA66228.1 hypothetical protein [Pseudomonas gessardii]